MIVMAVLGVWLAFVCVVLLFAQWVDEHDDE
jgi:hypothetical protein